MARLVTAAVAAAVCTAVAARPLPAQAAADTTLAGAVATVLADSLLDRLTDGPIIWQESSGSIDAAVAGALRMHPRFRGPVRDPRHTTWIGIRQVAEQGDTTWIFVDSGKDYGGSGFLTLYVDERAYLFTRAGGGWRFVRSQFLRHRDGSWVRG